MVNRVFFRKYRDNNKYAEDKLPYIDALAFTIQKYFYTWRNAIYCLMGTIYLHDFMSLTRYYIAASVTEFGQSDIATYISAMNPPYAQLLGGDAIEYTKDHNGIILNGTAEDILSLLWAAWIYARVRFDVASNDKKQMWQRATERLYNSMEDFYNNPKNECFEKSNKFLSMADDAMKTMKTYMAEKIQEGNYAPSQQSAPAKEQPVGAGEYIAQLQARVKELEAENEELKEQVEQFRNKEKGIARGLNQGQAALFGLAMANTFGFDYSNKKRDLAPLLHKLFGWGKSKLAYYLSTPCSNDERDDLANLFKDLCPRLYATIMNRGELPPEVTP